MMGSMGVVINVIVSFHSIFIYIYIYIDHISYICMIGVSYTHIHTHTHTHTHKHTYTHTHTYTYTGTYTYTYTYTHTYRHIPKITINGWYPSSPTGNCFQLPRRAAEDAAFAQRELEMNMAKELLEGL